MFNTNSHRPQLGLRKSPMVHRSATVTCKYCGNEQLQWRETDAGFKLFTLDGERHICEGMRKQAEYKREKDRERDQPEATPVNKLVKKIAEEMQTQLDTKNEEYLWDREEVMSMLERASLKALLQIV